MESKSVNAHEDTQDYHVPCVHRDLLGNQMVHAAVVIAREEATHAMATRVFVLIAPVIAQGIAVRNAKLVTTHALANVADASARQLIQI